MIAISSDYIFFRTHKANEGDKLRAEHTGPKSNSTLYFKGNTGLVLQSREQAEAHVLNGSSILIEGIAGTGKSFLANTMAERLKSLGSA